MARGQNETREAYLERRKLNHQLNADKERAYRKQAADKICETTKEWQKTVNGVFCVAYSLQRKNSKKRGHPMPDYTVDDLRARFENDEFMAMYDAWVQSGYQKDIKPSFDRKDANKPYTLDNLQLLTHSQNNQKGYKENRLKAATPVEIYDLSGSLLKVVNSLTEAVDFTGVCKSDVSLCLNGKAAQRKGFVFKRPEGVQKRKRGAKENISDLIDESIKVHGYFCSKIGFNSGVVANMSNDGIYPRFDGYDSVSVSYNSFTDTVTKLAEQKGLKNVVLVTKESRCKVFYDNLTDMEKGVRALSVLDKALTEFLNLQPVG